VALLREMREKQEEIRRVEQHALNERLKNEVSRDRELRLKA